MLGKCTYQGGTANETSVAYYRPIFDGATATLQSTCTQGGGMWN